MRFNLLAFLCYLGLVITQIACESKTVAPDVVGVTGDFYPLTLGRYTEYQVHQVNYTFVDGTIDTTFLLKEVVADTVRLSGNQLAYRLERYTRKDTSADWAIDSVYVAYLKDRQLIRVESSVPYVKLVYPLKVNSFWNGNLYNNNNGDLPENYTVTSLNTANDSVVLGHNTRVVQVLHRSDSNCRTNAYAIEKYAENFGLIERIYKSYAYKESTPPCTGIPTVEVGEYYRERIIGSGKQ